MQSQPVPPRTRFEVRLPWPKDATATPKGLAISAPGLGEQTFLVVALALDPDVTGSWAKLTLEVQPGGQQLKYG